MHTWIHMYMRACIPTKTKPADIQTHTYLQYFNLHPTAVCNTRACTHAFLHCVCVCLCVCFVLRIFFLFHASVLQQVVFLYICMGAQVSNSSHDKKTFSKDSSPLNLQYKTTKQLTVESFCQQYRGSAPRKHWCDS